MLYTCRLLILFWKYCIAWFSFCIVILCSLGCGLASVSHSAFLPSDTSEFLKKNKPKPVAPPTIEKKVDVLFVVDANPDLMDIHLKKVRQTFKNFIPNLNSVTSWKLAFTNADYNPEAFAYYRHDLLAGKTMPLQKNNKASSAHSLYSYSPHKEQIFLNTLERGIDLMNPCSLPPYCHSQAKNPVQSLIQAVSVNPDFFRRDSYATAVIFTNGDEGPLDASIKSLVQTNRLSDGQQPSSTISGVDANPNPASSNPNPGVQSSISPSPSASSSLLPLSQDGYDLAKALEINFQKHYGLHRKLKVYSIAIIPGDEICLQKISSARHNLPGISYAHKIYEVVRYTRGQIISICSSDYSNLARAIAQVE